MYNRSVASVILLCVAGASADIYFALVGGSCDVWSESVERYPFYTDAPRPRQTARMGGGVEAMRTIFYTIIV